MADDAEMEMSKETGEEKKMEKGRVETMEELKLKMEEGRAEVMEELKEAEVEWVQV